MNLHRHGSAWCLAEWCAPSVLSEGERILLKEMERYHPPGRLINLHYHSTDNEPCTGRFCRKRGTPKVEERDAFMVLAAGRASYWSRYRIVRCPRCKLHLGRHANVADHCHEAHGKPTHFCCPDSCELQSVRQAKELDTAVVTAAVSRRPYVPVTDQWDLVQDLADRAVPFKVFYVKLVREERAGRLHGCAHTPGSFCSGMFHLPQQCTGGC
jgi:hypothetical protein